MLRNIMLKFVNVVAATPLNRIQFWQDEGTASCGKIRMHYQLDGNKIHIELAVNISVD